MAKRLAGRFEAAPMAAINMTPMVPVLLVLFAVVAVSAARPGKAVNLYVEPGFVPAPYDPNRLQPRLPIVMLRANGDYFVGDQRVTRSEAAGRVKALAQRQGYNGAMIYADAEVPFENVALMVRDLHALGLTSEFVN
jgi:biopolymer transport protein ExbD